jgi:hypothetical protein
MPVLACQHQTPGVRGLWRALALHARCLPTRHNPTHGTSVPCWPSAGNCVAALFRIRAGEYVAKILYN